MFIPLHDTNRLHYIRFPYVTIGLIAFNILAYCMTTVGGEDFSNAAMLGLGFIPSVVYNHAELAPQFVVVPERWSYLTYSFLHLDILHLGGNMLFLWVFGDNVEDAMGHLRFLAFYLLSAAAGALVHGLVAPESQAPLIGASGAVAGVVAAYLLLYPRNKLWILAFARIPLRVPAWWALAAWIALQFVMFLGMSEDQISWACHVGGVLAGAAMVLVFKRRSVPLLAPAEAVADGATPVAADDARVAGARPAPRWGRQ
ncbi:rhomboid family intramembrane serine protease [Aquamicrobium ahrensii]|uniref:Membrane associated rhomboid family serine protease n=1 Tax=Aquamicrobium ahrensii TaxID=469551 RepID=A0ABV2KPL3_9HYPH